MKICFFNSNKAWGGGEQWHSETAIFMASQNVEVVVVAAKNSKLATKISQTPNIKLFQHTISKLSFLNPIKINRLKNLFQKMQPDIVVLNLPADAKAAGMAAKLANIKHIVYRRGSAIAIKNSFINRFLFSKIITNILCNSYSTAQTILFNNKNLFPAEKIKVIYNGTNISSLNSQLNKSETFVIGNAGRLEKQKAQHYLIDLAVLLKEKNIDFKILIAGEGRLKEELQNYTQEKNVSKNIEFLGFVNNLSEFFQQINVFVLTSLWEGFGYVLAEAAANKIPSIAFNLSSNPELIEDNKTGFLIPPFQVAAMAEKITMLAKNKLLCKQLGENAFERASQLFNKELNNKTLFNYFYHILSEKNS